MLTQANEHTKEPEQGDIDKSTPPCTHREKYVEKIIQQERGESLKVCRLVPK